MSQLTKPYLDTLTRLVPIAGAASLRMLESGALGRIEQIEGYKRYPQLYDVSACQREIGEYEKLLGLVSAEWKRREAA